MVTFHGAGMRIYCAVRKNMIQIAVWTSRSEFSCPYCRLLVTK